MIKKLGYLIENRRKQLGISREELARKIGVTSQTIINLEKDPDYNIGSKLLIKIEKCLQITFIISIKEETQMGRINFGNDEAILYIRKNYPNCTLDNKVLGRLIWEWLLSNANGSKLLNGIPQECYWGEEGSFLDEMKLPKTATQFEIERAALIDLYNYLDKLGNS